MIEIEGIKKIKISPPMKWWQFALLIILVWSLVNDSINLEQVVRMIFNIYN